MMGESDGLGETCGFLSLEKPHVLFLSALINRHSQAGQRNTPTISNTSLNPSQPVRSASETTGQAENEVCFSV